MLSSSISVTWNPADKNSNIVLSGGNLIATCNSTANNWQSLRATLSRDAATANHYFEYVITTVSSFSMVGIANNVASLTTLGQYVGAVLTSYGYYSPNGNTWNNGSPVAYGTGFVSGDNIGILLKNGKLYFRKNGVWQNSGDPIAQTGFAYTGISGNMFPAASLYTLNDVNTARFTSASFTYALPSGTSSWSGT